MQSRCLRPRPFLSAICLLCVNFLCLVWGAAPVQETVGIPPETTLPGSGGDRKPALALRKTLAKQPSHFMANRGQLGPEVRFHLQGSTHSVLLTRDGVILRRHQPSGKHPPEPAGSAAQFRGGQ